MVFWRFYYTGKRGDGHRVLIVYKRQIQNLKISIAKVMGENFKNPIHFIVGNVKIWRYQRVYSYPQRRRPVSRTCFETYKQKNWKYNDPDDVRSGCGTIGERESPESVGRRRLSTASNRVSRVFGQRRVIDWPSTGPGRTEWTMKKITTTRRRSTRWLPVSGGFSLLPTDGKFSENRVKTYLDGDDTGFGRTFTTAWPSWRW